MEIAKLFEYEGSQAVQLPQNCHFVGDEVYVNRVGEAVMLIPKDLKWNTSLFHLCYTYPVLFLCDWGIEKLFV